MKRFTKAFALGFAHLPEESSVFHQCSPGELREHLHLFGTEMKITVFYCVYPTLTLRGNKHMH